MPCPLTTRLSTYCLAALFVLLIAVMPGMQAVAQTDSSPSLRQLQGSADATASEPESDPEPGGRASVDAIAAIVNKDVITMRQLDQETETARAQMREQNIPEPDADTLRKQVLQRMILNTLELQEARAQGMEVNDAEVERVLDMIAERNGVSRETMRADIEASGFNWDVYIRICVRIFSLISCVSVSWSPRLKSPMQKLMLSCARKAKTCPCLPPVHLPSQPLSLRPGPRQSHALRPPTRR